MELTNVSGNIPLDLPKNSYLNICRDRGHPIHRFGGYPAKFIPELPRWAIEKYTKNCDTILDPFCGSGTTFVEAQLHGRNTMGTDHNPLARLLSKVKSTAIDETSLSNCVRHLKKALKEKTPSNIQLPEFSNRDFWFDNSVSCTLSFIKGAIDSIENVDVRDFFYVCFSDIVRPVSHSAPGQILPARRRNYHARKNLDDETVKRLFNKTLDEYSSSIIHFSKEKPKHTKTKIMDGDARTVRFEDVQAIITSPPYINAVDYIWATKLQSHWLGLVKNRHERLNLSSKEIGTERISSQEYRCLGKTGLIELDEKIEEIYKGTYYQASTNQNQLRARVVYKFFVDMKKHFENAYMQLPDNAYYCLVAGDNTICKVKIPTTDYLTRIAETEGFEKVFQFQILLKNRSLNLPRQLDWAGTIEYDRMIVLKK